MIEWTNERADRTDLRRSPTHRCRGSVRRDARHRAHRRGSAVRFARPAVHGVVRAAGQHDRGLHRCAGDRARARLLARSAGDGDRHGSRLAHGRIPVDVGSADRHRPVAQLPDGVWRRRRVARRSAMAGHDRVGRACRTVRWGSAFGVARHPVLARGADRAGSAGRGGLLRLRGHPPDAGGVDRGVVRDVRGVRGETRWGT